MNFPKFKNHKLYALLNFRELNNPLTYPELKFKRKNDSNCWKRSHFIVNFLRFFNLLWNTLLSSLLPSSWSLGTWRITRPVLKRRPRGSLRSQVSAGAGEGCCTRHMDPSYTVKSGLQYGPATCQLRRDWMWGGILLHWTSGWTPPPSSAGSAGARRWQGHAANHSLLHSTQAGSMCLEATSFTSPTRDS